MAKFIVEYHELHDRITEPMLSWLPESGSRSAYNYPGYKDGSVIPVTKMGYCFYRKNNKLKLIAVYSFRGAR